MIRIGISGFGRIGRLAARVALRRGDMEVVAINAPDKTPEQIAYVFSHDSVHGKWEGTVSYDEHHLIVDGKPILLLSSRDPSTLGWGELNVPYVVECTGKFLTAESVQPHLDAGAKFVLMSAPAKDKTPMFVYGVNHKTYSADLKVASAASCTSSMPMTSFALSAMIWLMVPVPQYRSKTFLPSIRSMSARASR